MKEIVSLLNRLSLQLLKDNITISLGDHAIYIDSKKGIATDKKIETQAVLEIDEQNFLDVLLGNKNIIVLLCDNKITLQGDISLAFQFKELLC